jgi:hypothetical protein
MGWKRVGYFVLVAPYFLAPTFFLALKVVRDLLGGAVLVSVAAVAAAFAARFLAARPPSKWSYRALVAFSVPAWFATASLSSVAYMALAIHRHVVDGSPYCWEPPTFETTRSCRGRDHSLLQGRLRYAETWGAPKAEVCRALLRGVPPIVCERNVSFALLACPPPYVDGWRCFGCKHLAATGDTYRTWLFLRGDCTEAAAWTSVNVEEAEMPDLLDGRRKPGQ